MSPTPTAATTPAGQKDQTKDIEALMTLLENIEKVLSDIRRRRKELGARLIDELKSGQTADPATMGANMFRRWKEAQTRKKELEEQEEAFKEMEKVVDEMIEVLGESYPDLVKKYKQFRQLKAELAKGAAAAGGRSASRARGEGKDATQERETGTTGSDTPLPDGKN